MLPGRPGRGDVDRRDHLDAFRVPERCELRLEHLRDLTTSGIEQRSSEVGPNGQQLTGLDGPTDRRELLQEPAPTVDEPIETLRGRPVHRDRGTSTQHPVEIPTSRGVRQSVHIAEVVVDEPLRHTGAGRGLGDGRAPFALEEVVQERVEDLRPGSLTANRSAVSLGTAHQRHR